MREAAKNLARSAAIIGVTVAAMGVTGTAQAATGNCPSGGKLPGGDVCTTLSSGVLHHWKTSQGTGVTVKTRYEKKSGSKITAKLGYSWKGKNYWGGQFTQSKGQVKQKTWNRYEWSSKCHSTIGMMWVKGQGTFQTPPGTC